jgi:peptidoglycan hydrolase-like protein with peptidoglycan-binding domain
MDAKEVQGALRQLGWPIEVDGSFGPVTRQAVLDFQQAFSFHDLLVDGFAGPQVYEALRRCIDSGGKCGTYFAFREFKSKGDGWIKVSRALVRALDAYRQRYGPTKVTSGYRDIKHNQKVGGARNSQHLYGNAADIPGVASRNAVQNLGLFSGIGYRARDGLVVHVDVRHVGPNTTGGSPSAPTVWQYG